MNLLESYIEEIHSVKPYTADWTNEFSDREFVEVDITINCYGGKERKKRIWNTKEWDQIKKQGFYWS